MDILNVKALEKGWRRHPQTRQWLQSWLRVAAAADWSNIVDVRKAYPSADGVTFGRGGQRIVVTIFNVGGNDFRLLTRINFAGRRVTVDALLTHAQYGKGRWKSLS